jgi:rhodanese-related sulfurtransferase
MTEQATQLTIEAAGALAPLVTPDQAAARVDAGAVLIDVRSAAATTVAPLIRRGFTDVVHVEGGVPAWKDAVGGVG